MRRPSLSSRINRTMVRPSRFRMLVVVTRIQSSRKGSTVCNPETLAMHGRSRVAIADPAKPDVPSRRSDEYSDVPSMFRTLRALPVESAEFARQRERIAARCLPLAEHIGAATTGAVRASTT